MYAFCLSCPSTSLVALQHDGFVSREWLAANGLLRYRSFCLVATKKKGGNTILQLRACLHEGGGPLVGEVTCGGLPHLTCKRDHIKMKDCMDRRVTPPKRVTSRIWGPPPPCKQALNKENGKTKRNYDTMHACNTYTCKIFVFLN